jgi:hypothetical protein
MLILTIHETDSEIEEMKPGDLVVVSPRGAYSSSVRAWSVQGDGFFFFEVACATVGTVLEVHDTPDALWIRVMFPQGIGWIVADDVICV